MPGRAVVEVGGQRNNPPFDDAIVRSAREKNPTDSKWGIIGRNGGIRTHDPLTPSQVRYRAALHSDLLREQDFHTGMTFLAQAKNPGLDAGCT